MDSQSLICGRAFVAFISAYAVRLMSVIISSLLSHRSKILVWHKTELEAFFLQVHN